MVDYIWAPEQIWNAWAVPLIQVACAGVLFAALLVTCYKLAKAALGKWK